MPPIVHLNAVIVDDEPGAVDNLRKLTDNYCPSINIVGTAAGVDAAAILINNIKPDVVFLDISMPRKNGFELFPLLTHFPAIVFVTAYEKYALNAIKASALDFLLKPVDVNELKNVEEKLLKIRSFRKDNNAETYSSALGNLASMIQNPGIVRSITLPDNEGYNIIDLSEIIYLEGVNNYTAFHLHRKPKILVSKTLKEYEELLAESGFMRIHKSSIINMRHLKKLSVDDAVTAQMSDGSILAVSRRRASELTEMAKQYNF